MVESTPAIAQTKLIIMVINKEILKSIEVKAKESIRLRANLCLHTSPDEKVQKMINVLLPGTEMPIHRHLNSDETLTILKGKVTIIYFDDDGHTKERIEMSQISGTNVVDIPKGVWHNVEVSEPVTLLEIKEGPYRPLNENEIL